MQQRRAGFKLIEVATAALILCMVVAIGVPNYLKAKDRGRESQAKENLHEIQLHVERFAVDTEGTYPQYLIGGEAGQTLDKTSDPLLRKGYLKAYPKNPFYRDSGREVLDYQRRLPDSLIYKTGDPLRPGPATAKTAGYRFGQQGTLMGSVLADPRFRTWIYADAAVMKTQAMSSYADVEYDFWDTEKRAGGTNDYLPGEFFYKGVGPIIAVAGDVPPAPPVLPTEVDSYIMGVYGAVHNPGKDVLGPEREFNLVVGKGPTTNHVKTWGSTASQVGGADRREGSPFSPGCGGDSNEQLQYGNPNGIRDSVVLCLTAGED